MSDGLVARGRIKVDARRALDKLRDHMLVDPHLWACEIARVAVALGATELDVGWDADEVVLQWRGRALGPEQIAHARDHVLVPLAGPDGDALRLLGIGIGAALSLDPAYVEVVSSGQAVRFERTYVEDERAAPVPVPAPGDASPGLTRVRFKRRFGLGLLSRISTTPEEIELVRAAFDAASCRLRVRGQEIVAPNPVVLTVDLDIPGTTRAQLEILRRPTEPRIDYLHHGLRLSSAVFVGLWGLVGVVPCRLPVRIVVDAPDLPTNASRSEIRADSPVLDLVHARIGPAFEVAVAALRGEPTSEAARIGHVVTVRAEPGVLADVLGAFAAEAAIALRAKRTLDPAAHRLLADLVLVDPFGRPLALQDLRGGTPEQPVRVHDGTTPLPEALGAWIRGAIWRRGCSAERVLEALSVASAKDLVEPALAAMKRRERALAHPASKPVTSKADADWREAFTATEGRFAGLEGELAMGGGVRLASVRVYVDDRLLETVTLPGVRLPVELALSWPGHLFATFAYDAVERNEDLTAAVQYGIRVAAMSVAGRECDASLVRLATQSWADATRALGDGRVEPAALGRLATRPVWRTNEPGRLVTFAAVYAYAKLTGALCHAAVNRPAADGRAVLEREDAHTLRSILQEGVELVAYDRALSANPDVSEGIPVLSVMIHRPGLEGFVAPTPAKIGRLRVYHAGVCLRQEVWRPRNGGVDVVLVDHAAVPQPDFRGLRYASPIPNLDAEEDALVEVVTQACESDAVELDSMASYLELSRSMLLDRKERKPLAKRIAALPQRREQRRRERLRELVLARPPIDVDAALGARPRGSFVASGRGAVTVALAPIVPATLLYRGHPLGSALVGTLDVEAYVDVVDEAFVQEWRSLSEAGMAWAEDAVALAARSLLEKLAPLPGFADDELALGLMASLLATPTPEVRALLGQVRWPTVQGTTMSLGEALEVSTGAHRFAPWRSGSDVSPYDAPAIHLPASKLGELRKKVLRAAGVRGADVTDATMRLQALRARAVADAPPRLEGTPPHPLLRRTLAELGATSIEGEVELVDGSTSDIGWVRPDRVREAVPLSLGIPVRAVFRGDMADPAAAAAELREVVRALVRRLVRDLESQPPFVVRRVRGLVLAGVAETGTIAETDRDVPMFEATNGRFYRLAFLQGYASYTTDPPPYPPIDDIVLVLDPTEVAPLSKVFELRDDTLALRARARGLAARAAPPLTEIRVNEREQCLFFIEVNEEGVRGEIGLLKPSHAASRRIDVFSTMRPLTSLPDPEGWPIVAALNDDSLVVDDGFSALVDAKKDTTRLHQLVRRLLGASLSRFLEAPLDTLGIVRLPVPLLLRGVRGKRVAAAMGVFWLPRTWPEHPTIHIEGIGFVDDGRLPLADAGERASRVVPVSGKLWITAEAGDVARGVEDVMAWVSARLPVHVRSRRGAERYLWDLALLGVVEDPAIDPVAELAKDRPSEDLVHVAARRAPHLIDRTTGDAPTAPVHVAHASFSPDALDAAPAPAPVPDRPSDAGPPESIFSGVVRRVRELVTGVPETIAETPLTAALSAAIGALALSGQPVACVQSARRGRPVRYEPDERRLIVNTAHPVVVAHAKGPNGVLFLLLAALSEINRELASVTDAEEVAKILELLRANEG